MRLVPVVFLVLLLVGQLAFAAPRVCSASETGFIAEQLAPQARALGDTCRAGNGNIAGYLGSWDIWTGESYAIIDSMRSEAMDGCCGTTHVRPLSVTMPLRTVAAAGVYVGWLAHAEIWSAVPSDTCDFVPGALICAGAVYRVGWAGAAGYYVDYPLDFCTTDLPRTGVYFNVVVFDSAGTGAGSPCPYVSVDATPCPDWYNGGTAWVGFSAPYLLSMESSFECTGDVPVEMSSLNAVAVPGEVQVRWRTESELENLGFNVYRATDGDKTKINEWMIPGAGTTLSPTDYQFVDQDVTVGTRFQYWVSDVDFSGAESFHGPVVVVVPQESPADLGLTADASGGTVTLSMAIPTEGSARLAVYDMAGHEVAVLVNQVLPAGRGQIEWDGSTAGGQAAAGAYVVRLVHTTGVVSAKAVLR
ncbi:MAG: hypothetical protein MUE60_07075 [Candidatus Eisenbacteria bacterium]|jgi:hypothetical protein|nr:hypothetical protein [Candidatus Eisenbacteria bacterium]